MLTGLATEEKRSACLANGAELFIEKPRSSDGLKAVFAMLDELMTWKPREGFQGMLRKVGLQDVIQMECLGRNSCVLEISNPAGVRTALHRGRQPHPRHRRQYDRRKGPAKIALVRRRFVSIAAVRAAAAANHQRAMGIPAHGSRARAR